MARGAAGQGTVYKDVHPTRRTKWRAERTVRLPDGTRRRLVARGFTQGEALAKLDRRIRALERAHPSAERMTVRAFLNTEWLETKRGAVKPSTLAEYERIVALVVKECGHIPLAHVQTSHLQAAVNAAVDRKHLGTAVTIRRYMRGAFKHAVMAGLLTKNPAEGIPRLYRNDPKRMVWEPQEAQRFLAAVRKDFHPGYYALFYTALLTGLRMGELLALRWADVTPKSVRVRASVSRYAPGGVGTPKTSRSTRTVPITREAYEAIKEARSALPASEWAFPNTMGGRIQERNLRRTFDRGVELTAKPDADPPLKAVPRIRIHDLRRTAATWWATDGVPPKVIQRLLGHSTPRLALEIYNDVLDGQVDNAALDPGKWLSGGNIGGSAD